MRPTCLALVAPTSKQEADLREIDRFIILGNQPRGGDTNARPLTLKRAPRFSSCHITRSAPLLSYKETEGRTLAVLRLYVWTLSAVCERIIHNDDQLCNMILKNECYFPYADNTHIVAIRSVQRVTNGVRDVLRVMYCNYGCKIYLYYYWSLIWDVFDSIQVDILDIYFCMLISPIFTF